MRLISEVLPHFHAFCNWALRDKKPNYLNSVSVFIAPGRRYKIHIQLFVLSKTYLNSHMCSAICPGINCFCYPKFSHFLQLHIVVTSSAKFPVNYNMLSLIRQSL